MKFDLKKIDWKKVGIGASIAVAGTAVGAGLVTAIGFLVDGDEVFTFESGTAKAVVVSYRNGIFAHAHPLEKLTEKERQDLNVSANDIAFKIGKAAGHFHSVEEPYYRIVYENRKCRIEYKTTNGNWLEIKEGMSQTGLGHEHKLEVISYSDGTNSYIYTPLKI